MFDALIAGLVQVVAWPAIGLMLVGIGVGFVVGILPGIGGATALALMLPFIFKMQPAEAVHRDRADQRIRGRPHSTGEHDRVVGSRALA